MSSNSKEFAIPVLLTIGSGISSVIFGYFAWDSFSIADAYTNQISALEANTPAQNVSDEIERLNRIGLAQLKADDFEGWHETGERLTTLHSMTDAQKAAYVNEQIAHLQTQVDLEKAHTIRYGAGFVTSLVAAIVWRRLMNRA